MLSPICLSSVGKARAPYSGGSSFPQYFYGIRYLGHPFPLKMICNDFLVVKVNCLSSVFNIMKSISLLRNVKNATILEKSVLKCSPDDLFTFWNWWCHTRKTSNQTLQTACWVLNVDCRPRCNIFVIHWEISVVKTGKITFYRVSIATQTKTSSSWYDVS